MLLIVIPNNYIYKAINLSESITANVTENYRLEEVHLHYLYICLLYIALNVTIFML